MNSLELLRQKLSKPTTTLPRVSDPDDPAEELRKKLFKMKNVDVTQETKGVPFSHTAKNRDKMKFSCPHMRDEKPRGQDRKYYCMHPENVRDYVHGDYWGPRNQYTTKGVCFFSCRGCTEAPEFGEVE